MTELLAAGIDCRPVRPAGGVRVNITITEPDGTTTKLNSPDASVGAVHLEAMASTLLARAPVAAWTVLAGSLPAGAPPEFSAQLVRRLRDAPRHGGSGHQDAPLRALVESDPVKAAQAARILIDRGVGTVLATLGSNGAVLVTAEGSWHAAPPPTTVVSTVGLQSVRLSTRRHPRAVGARSPGARRGLRQRPPGSPGPPSPRRRTSTPTTHVGALMPTKSVVVGSAVGRRPSTRSRRALSRISTPESAVLEQVAHPHLERLLQLAEHLGKELAAVVGVVDGKDREVQPAERGQEH